MSDWKIAGFKDKSPVSGDKADISNLAKKKPDTKIDTKDTVKIGKKGHKTSKYVKKPQANPLPQSAPALLTDLEEPANIANFDIKAESSKTSTKSPVITTTSFVKVGSTALPLNTSGETTYIPGKESELVQTETTIKNMERIMKGIELGDSLLLEGETGGGKSAVIKYLAHLTNNELRQLNFNEQTDTTEVIGGYKPVPVEDKKSEERFKWVDAVLLEAMTKGQWVLIDEINLAEPAILERLNSLLDDDGYLVLTEANNEKRKPHSNFRLFATMNPASYAGRKELSPAMKNRFHMLSIDVMPTVEMARIIEERSKLSHDIALSLVTFHKQVQDMALERQIGKENRAYFTLRDVMKTANRIKDFPSSTGDIREAIYRELMAVYGDALTDSADRKVISDKITTLFDMKDVPKVENLELSYVTKSGDKYLKIGSFIGISKLHKKKDFSLRRNDNVEGSVIPHLMRDLSYVEVKVNSNPKTNKFIPNKEKILINTPQTLKKSEKVLKCVYENEPVLLIGDTASGKTSLLQHLAHFTNNNCIRINLGGQSDTSDIVGGIKPTQKGFEWLDGLLVEAMKNGYWVILDEINLAAPAVLERLNQLLDKGGKLVLSENRNEEIKVHPDFRIFATMNPSHYAGRKKLSPAFLNRFSKIYFEDIKEKNELSIISKQFLKGKEDIVSDKLVEFHTKLVEMTEKGEIGTKKRNNYIFSIRNIRSFTKYYNKHINEAQNTAKCHCESATDEAISSPTYENGKKAKIFDAAIQYAYSDGIVNWMDKEKIRKLLSETTKDTPLQYERKPDEADLNLTPYEITQRLKEFIATNNVRSLEETSIFLERFYPELKKINEIFNDPDTDTEVKAEGQIALLSCNFPDEIRNILKQVALKFTDEPKSKEVFIKNIDKIGFDENETKIFIKNAIDTVFNIHGGDDKINKFLSHFNEVEIGELIQTCIEKGSDECGILNALIIMPQIDFNLEIKAEIIRKIFSDNNYKFYIKAKAAEILGDIAFNDKTAEELYNIVLNDKTEGYDGRKAGESLAKSNLPSKTLEKLIESFITKVLPELQKYESSANWYYSYYDSINDVRLRVIPALKNKNLNPEIKEKFLKMALFEIKNMAANEDASKIITETGLPQEVTKKLLVSALDDNNMRKGASESINNANLSPNDLKDIIQTALKSDDILFKLNAVKAADKANMDLKIKEDVIRNCLSMDVNDDKCDRNVIFIITKDINKFNLDEKFKEEIFRKIIFDEKFKLLRYIAFDNIGNANFKTEILAEFFERGLNDSSEYIRRLVLSSLKNANLPIDIKERLIEKATKDKSVSVKNQTLTLANEINLSAQTLENVIKNTITDETVRPQSASLILKGVITPQTKAELLNIISNDPNPKVRKYAQIANIRSFQIKKQDTSIMTSITPDTKNTILIDEKSKVLKEKPVLNKGGSSITITSSFIKINETELPLNTSGETTYIPGKESELVQTETTIKNMERIMKGIELGDSLLLEGETGGGKSAVIKYLAHLTNNELRQLNFNEQTDTTEVIGGYKPVPVEDKKSEERFKWVDAVLLEAMTKGQWVLIDEINLAEPAILERLNSLLDDDGYLVLTEANNEKRKPHPNFRLFATMNPASYAGRKELSPAMKNRFHMLSIDVMPTVEMARIIEERSSLSHDVALALVTFHKQVQDMALERQIGKENRAYFTLRDVMKTANRIKDFPSSTGDIREAIYRELMAVYGDALTDSADRKVISDKITTLFDMKDVPKGEKPELSYVTKSGDKYLKIGSFIGISKLHKKKDFSLRRNDNVEGSVIPHLMRDLSCVEVKINSNPKTKKFIPNKEKILINTPQTLKKSEKVLKCVYENEPVLLIGGTASGKTSLLQHLAHFTNNNCIRINLGGQSDTSDIVGGIKPTQKGFEWLDGLLVEAMKNGYWVILDEINLASPAVLERLNQLLDKGGKLVLSENRNEEIKVHPDFRIFATMNPSHYAGRKKLSPAFLNRFSKITFEDIKEKNELSIISKQFLKGKEDIISDKLVEFHTKLLEETEKGEIGTKKRNNYVFSIRNIRSFCKYYKKHIGKKDTEAKCFDDAISYAYLDGISNWQDKEKIKKLLSETTEDTTLHYERKPDEADLNLTPYEITQRLKEFIATNNVRSLEEASLFLERFYPELREINEKLISDIDESEKGGVKVDLLCQNFAPEIMLILKEIALKFSGTFEEKSIFLQNCHRIVFPTKKLKSFLKENGIQAAHYRHENNNLCNIIKALFLDDEIFEFFESSLNSKNNAEYAGFAVDMLEDIDFGFTYSQIEKLVITIFQSNNRLVKNQALGILKKIPLKQHFKEELITKLIKDNSKVLISYEVNQLLTEYKISDNLKNELLNLDVATTNPEFIKGCLRTIDEKTNPEITNKLISKNLNNSDIKIKTLAIKKIGLAMNISDKEKERIILEAYNSDIPELKITAIEAIGTGCVDVSITKKIFREIFEGNDNDLKIYAIIALSSGKTELELTEELINKAILDPNWDKSLQSFNGDWRLDRKVCMFLDKFNISTKLKEKILRFVFYSDGDKNETSENIYKAIPALISANINPVTTEELLEKAIKSGDFTITFLAANQLLLSNISDTAKERIFLDTFNLSNINFPLNLSYNIGHAPINAKLKERLIRKCLEYSKNVSIREQGIKSIVNANLDPKITEEIFNNIINNDKKLCACDDTYKSLIKCNLPKEKKVEFLNKLLDYYIQSNELDIYFKASFVIKGSDLDEYTQKSLTEKYKLPPLSLDETIVQTPIFKPQQETKDSTPAPKQSKVEVKDNILSVGSALLPLNTSGEETYIPGKESELVQTETTIKNMERIMKGIELGDSLLLEGETGGGKSAVIKYLAHLTNNELRQLNFNEQTDTTEVIGGYKPVPVEDKKSDERFKWVDAVLLEAMTKGQWVLIDEINLAEPAILERLNSLLDDDGYLVLTEANNEKRKPHSNFRLFATMNPASYAGRKELSPAMKNRFHMLSIDVMPTVEMARIIEERSSLSHDVALALVTFHKQVQDMALERQIGKENRAYFTLRDVMKVANRIKDFPSSSGDMRESIYRELMAVYGDALTDSADRKVISDKITTLFDMKDVPKVENLELSYVTKSGDKYLKIGSFIGISKLHKKKDFSLRRNDNVEGSVIPHLMRDLSYVEVKVNSNPKTNKFIPNKEKILINTPQTLKKSEKVLKCVYENEPVLLIGDTASGKTSLLQHLAHFTNNNCIRINLGGQSDTSDIVGGIKPTQKGFEWLDGLLVEAMKNGYWVILDEINLASPAVLERLNQLLDKGGKLVLSENRNEEIKVHPDFRIFATMNPSHYAGRKKLSPAFLNRFSKITFEDIKEKDELSIISKQFLKGKEDIVSDKLVEFHTKLIEATEKGEIGTKKRNNYVFSIRNIRSFCKYYNRHINDAQNTAPCHCDPDEIGGSNLGTNKGNAKCFDDAIHYAYLDGIGNWQDKEKITKLLSETTKDTLLQFERKPDEADLNLTPYEISQRLKEFLAANTVKSLEEASRFLDRYYPELKKINERLSNDDISDREKLQFKLEFLLLELPDEIRSVIRALAVRVATEVEKIKYLDSYEIIKFNEDEIKTLLDNDPSKAIKYLSEQKLVDILANFFHLDNDKVGITLKDGFKSDDWPERKHIIETIHYLKSKPEIISELLKIGLNDSEELNRSSAGSAVGNANIDIKLKENFISEQITALENNPENEKCGIIDALYAENLGLNLDVKQKIIKDALSSKNKYLRAKTYELELSEIKDKDLLIKLLNNGLEDPEPVVRGIIPRAILFDRKRLTTDAAEKLLYKAFADPAPEVRKKCLCGLTTHDISPSTRFDIFLKGIKDPSLEVRREAILETMSIMDDPELVKNVISIALKDNEETMRSNALNVIATCNIDEKRIKELFEEVINDNSGNFSKDEVLDKLSLASRIERLNNPLIIDELTRKIEKKDWSKPEKKETSVLQSPAAPSVVISDNQLSAVFKAEGTPESPKVEVLVDGVSPDTPLISTELNHRLESIIRSLSGDYTINLLPGDWWKYDFSSNTIYYGAKDVAGRTDEEAIAIILHETSHKNYSKWLIEPELMNESFQFLVNAIEDPRVNNIISARFGGVKNYFKTLYDKSTSPDKHAKDIEELVKKTVKEDPTMTPDQARQLVSKPPKHKQYGWNIINYWHTGKFQDDIDTDVREALELTKDDFVRAFSFTKSIKEQDLTEEEKYRLAMESYVIIRDKIRPIYEKLVEKSEQELASDILRLKIGGCGCGGQGDNEALKEALKKAKKIIIEIDKQSNNKLAPKDKSESKPDPELEKLLREKLKDIKLDDLLKKAQQLQDMTKAGQSRYDKFYNPAAPLIDEFVGEMENVLHLNEDPKFKGDYNTGKKLNLKKIVQAEAKFEKTGLYDAKLWLRKDIPEQRKYKFVIVLDESGSMEDETKARNAFQALIMASETLSTLGVDFSIVGFHNTAFIHKDFEKEYSMATRDEIFDNVLQTYGNGGTNDHDGVKTAYQLVQNEEDCQKIIIVISDGEGNGPQKLKDLLPVIEQDETCKVIGVGIGDGMKSVNDVYTHKVLVPNINKLAHSLANVIEEELTRDY